METTAVDRLAAKAHRVPLRLTPPSVPGTAGSKDLIRYVEPVFILRSSVAHVSAVATAIADIAPRRNTGDSKVVARTRHTIIQNPLAQTCRPLLRPPSGSSRTRS